MKKNVIFAVLILLLYILPGCGSSPANLGEKYFFAQDDQFYYDKYALVESIAESENGYYFMSGPHLQYLYYMDKNTMKPVILCNKPDCLHTDETEMYKVTDCNAFWGANKYNLVYYDSNLYIGGFYSPLGHIYSIVRVSLDGTQRKEIFTFKNYLPEKWTIHRGYLYYTVNDHGDTQGQETATISTCMLYRIDLNHMGKEPTLLNEATGFDESTASLFAYGNGVYWLVSGFNETFTEEIRQAYRYSIQNGKTELILEDIDYLSVCGGQLVFESTDGIMYKSNLDGSDKREIGRIRTGFGFIHNDGSKYIYCDTVPLKYMPDGDKNARSLRVYDLQGNLVSTVNIDSLGKGFSYGCNGDYFFIPDNGSASNQYGKINLLWAINVKKIESGDPAIEKLFEFVPKVPYTPYVVESN